jgi:xanthine dehydrogenase D subunit/xanthine dehydrogenase C subunit
MDPGGSRIANTMTAASAPRDVLRPRSIAAALEHAVSSPSARFIAAGTALQLDWARGIAAPATLISLGDIAGLKGVSHAGGIMRIGALTPLGELERDPEVAHHLPLLSAAILGVAAPSVRQLATLGGNVAGRTGCLLPALLALDATLVGYGAAGAWRRSLHEWLTAAAVPDAIITAIELPQMPGDCRWTQRKVGLRAGFSPSVIGVAGLMHLDAGLIGRARLCVGGGVVPPARLIGAEARLEGLAWDSIDWPAFHESVIAEIAAPDDAFRSGRYRRLAAGNALSWGLGARLSAPRGLCARRPRLAANTGRIGTSTAAPATGAPGEIRLARQSQPARWHSRPEGAAKIAGSFRYLTDHRTDDMLVGRILRAHRAHARIISLDTTRAEALPGVVAVVTHRDIPGQNAFGIVVQDQPALCHDTVRYVGDAVAAVAAVDAATAAAALELIDVHYESLPVVTDPEQALAPDAQRVHRGGNLTRRIEYARGDVDAGFAASRHTLEDTYVTPRQMHGFMETEGGWAVLQSDGTLALHVGGQHGLRDRQQLARILAMPEDKIRVVTSPTGGAFGGKDELTVQPALALLALKSRRPVRLQLSRTESVLAGTKRHPMRIRMRTGCDAEGRLLAQEVDLLADAGAYASLGPSVLETALEHAAGTYEIPHVRTHGRLAYTNNGVGGAFRGFGANQMNYAVECQVDRLAALCGLTPVEFRRRNLKKPNGPGYFGQRVAPSERLLEMWAAAAASPLWALEREAGADECIGVGMAMNHHGNGLGSVIPDPAGGRLRLARDGRIEACFTLDEMGQGLLALIVAVVAGELGCGRDDVRPVFGDTANGPDSGPTTAARGTFVVWQTTRLAAPIFALRLRVAAARCLRTDPDRLRLGVGGMTERSPGGPVLIGYAQLAGMMMEHDLPCVDSRFDYPKADYAAGNARFFFASGACVARVAVSRITGEVRVLDLDQRSAAGPVMDVAAYLGQQEGGAVQGIGFTLCEDATMTQGDYDTTNFDTYMMPSSADAPERMDVYALEGLDAGDTFGPRGVGELGVGAVTPAIANAVFEAIGMCPTVSPISPESILDALGARDDVAAPR